jgi:DNA-binding XRE family transcriptional regulator
MIRSEREYQAALSQLEEYGRRIELQRQELVAKGYNPEEVERGLHPLYSFAGGLRDEVGWYERACRGDFDAISDFTGLGRLLIAMRLARGLTQRQLAGMLNVSEAQVSRDERNEYHGITKERARRIVQALNYHLNLQVAPAVVDEPRPIPSLQVVPVD